MAWRPGVGNIAKFNEGTLKKKIQLYAEAGDVFSNIVTPGFVSGVGFANRQDIEGSAIIPAGYNSTLLGPITIVADSSLTISLNSVLKIT